MLDIKINARQLDALARRFDAAGAKGRQEIERAMISVRRATATEAKRAVADQYNLAQKWIGSAQVVRQAGPRGFTISGNNRPIPAAYYGAKALARGGVAVKFARGKRVVIEDGFAGKPPQGGDNKLWQRTGEAPRRATKGRYAGSRALREPIDIITGPSAADHLLNRKVRQRLDGFFVQRFGNEVARRLARITSRRG